MELPARDLRAGSIPSTTDRPTMKPHTPLQAHSRRHGASLLPLAAVAALCAGLSTAAHADTGKLLLTGGVSTIEGAVGGGLSPWAVIVMRTGENPSSGSPLTSLGLV